MPAFSPAAPTLENSSSADGYLRIVDMCKDYQEGGHTRRVLEHTSLAVVKGEFVAILGKKRQWKDDAA